MLWWRIILEEYGSDIEYVAGDKYIAKYVLSQLPNNRNQETTHESTYLMETISELYDIKELIEVAFPLSFNFIDFYQQEDPILTGKLTCAEYKRVIFAEAEIL